MNRDEDTSKRSSWNAKPLTEKFTNSFHEVSIIGLRIVIQSSSSTWRRLIWIALILAGTGFTIYQIQDRVLFYLSWPTRVGIRVEHVDSMRFPTITVCNENRVIKTIADKMNITEPLSKLFPVLPDPNFTPFPPNTTDFSTEAAESIGLSWRLNYFLTAQQQSNAILSAHFNGKELTSEILHLDELFRDYFNRNNRINYDGVFYKNNTFTVTPTNIGFCFTFNSNFFNFTSVQPGGPGVLLGLQLILNVQPDEYLLANSMSTGFRVMIYDKEEFPEMELHSFTISPGFSTQVSVSAEYMTYLPFPYGDCNNSVNYKESQCLIQCLSDYVIKRCQCTDVYMTGNAPVCGPTQLGSCAIPAKNAFVLNNMAASCNCAHQCNTLSYNAQITPSLLSDLAVKSINATHKLNMTFEEIRRNYAVLEVFFSDLTNTYIETTTAYDSFSLLCDIGGALGLILGSTMLTFCEVIDATLTSFLTWPFRRRQKVEHDSPM